MIIGTKDFYTPFVYTVHSCLINISERCERYVILLVLSFKMFFTRFNDN